MTQYRFTKSPPAGVREALSEYPDHLQQLLYRRGIATISEAQRFINPSYDEHLHDPFLLNDIKKATERITTAISKNETVVIYSDYDCDGIPGAVILHDFFNEIGFSNFTNYFPHRHYDGFGLTETALSMIHEKHTPALVITIDCGTTDIGAVHWANEHGIDVIITDHHEPKAELPPAVAIVNPKVGNNYPFSELCGAGVVFKLVQALLKSGEHQITLGKEKWWLDMVGLATIADMVPLLDENRVLATYGLTVLRKSRRPGLQQLLRAQRANQSQLSEDDIGFTIAPRINAASRMDTPEDAFALLATQDIAEAGAKVTHLEKLNRERKTAVALMTKEVHKRLSQIIEIPPIIVMGSPDWRPSLVGLSAGKLAEEHRRPVFMWGRDGNGWYKGSCRSGGTASVVKIMEVAPELFVEFGGHHMSGGFTIVSEAIHDFSDRLVAAYKMLGESVDVSEEVEVDMELTLDMVTEDFLKTQALLAPFGHSNPKPIYLFSRVAVETVEVFGKAKEHTKLTFATSGRAKEAIAFFRKPDTFSLPVLAGAEISFLAHAEQSYFMNRLQTRLRLIDIVD